MSAREKEPVWARIDVDYLRNRKVIGLSDRAIVEHISLINWCKEQGTNGHVPGAVKRSLARSPAAWRELEHAELLIVEPDGWTLSGFAERNGDEAARQAAREIENAARNGRRRRREPSEA